MPRLPEEEENRSPEFAKSKKHIHGSIVTGLYNVVCTRSILSFTLLIKIVLIIFMKNRQYNDQRYKQNFSILKFSIKNKRLL